MSSASEKSVLVSQIYQLKRLRDSLAAQLDDLLRN
jgi:hypothetical protein